MRISVGIDVAKEVHWATAVTQDGRVLLDRKVESTAADIGRLAVEVAALKGERLIGIDLYSGIATLLSAMLLAAGERLVHVAGLAVNRSRQGSRQSRPAGVIPTAFMNDRYAPNLACRSRLSWPAMR